MASMTDTGGGGGRLRLSRIPVRHVSGSSSSPSPKTPGSASVSFLLSPQTGASQPRGGVPSPLTFPIRTEVTDSIADCSSEVADDASVTFSEPIVSLPADMLAPPGNHVATTDDSPTQVEQQMDMEVEKVLREWDTNIQCRTQDTFTLRSSKPVTPTQQQASPGGGHRSRKRYSSHNSTSSNNGIHRRVFEFPEIDVIRRQDMSFDTSQDTIEDDPRTPLYVTHPLTGARLFRMEFDIDGFDEQNVTVKVSGSRLVIHAIQTTDGNGKKSSTEFCRKIKLPKDVNRHELQCHYNGDTKSLVVEAPILSSQPPTPSSPSTLSTVGSPRPTPEPLNQPLIRPGPDGRTLHLTVEVGRVFHSEDVVVKVRGANKILISAEREESNMHSKLSAKLSREFDLSHRIDPASLKAGLTTDGLLRVTATVVEGSLGSDSSSVNENNAPSKNGTGLTQNAEQ